MKNRSLLSLVLTCVGYVALALIPIQDVKAGQSGTNAPGPCICTIPNTETNEIDRRGVCMNPQNTGDVRCIRPDGLCDFGYFKWDCVVRPGRNGLALGSIKSQPPKSPKTSSPGRGVGIVVSLLAIIGGLLLLATLVKSSYEQTRNVQIPSLRRGRKPLITRSLSFRAATALLALAFVILPSVGSNADRISVSNQSTPLVASRNQRDDNQQSRFTSGVEVGGTGISQIGGTSIDRSGNLYVAGGFTGTMVFETTPRTILTSSADYDLFVAKYDPSGRPLWARVANGASTLQPKFSLDGGLALAVDREGNSYVGGGFVEELNFKDASGNTVATLRDSGSGINIEQFVAKYDADGKLLWARGGNSGSKNTNNLREGGINGILDIVIDGAGNPYLAGTFSGANFLGKPVSVMGENDILLSRLDPATGNPVWVATVGSENFDNAMGIAVDDAANIYIVGDLTGTATFPTQPIPTTLVIEEEEDEEYEAGAAFIAKYDSNGQALWVNGVDGTGSVFAGHIAVNGSGDIYVVGDFAQEATFGSVTLSSTAIYSGFLAKYDTNGNPLWARMFGQPSIAIGERVALDGAGNPTILGLFLSEATFGEEFDGTSRTISTPDEDMFIAKYDASGSFKWVRALGAEGEESQNTIEPDVIILNITPIRLVLNPVTGTLNLSGDFSGTLFLDDVTMDAGSNRHGFVAALQDIGPDAIAPTVEIISPADGQKMKRNKRSTIEWESVDNVAVVSQDVLLSLDGGQSFMTLASGLPNSSSSFDFTPASDHKTKKAIVRVIAKDAAGNQGQSDSDRFKIK